MGRAVFLLLILAVCAYLGQTCEDNSALVGMLAKHMMLQQFFAEERIRSEGRSGIQQTRQMATGTKSYHTNSYVHTGGVAAIHEHANNIRTVGMGEFSAILNGVPFRTRHNDYALRMPNPDSAIYNDAVEIPFPEVPPEVLAKPDVESQSLELREWFKAWKNDDYSERDFRPYFKPVLCYLEGGWTSSKSDDIDEPFASDRHFIDALKWSEMMQKVRYTSFTGTKSRFENFAYLPTTIMEVVNDTIPIFAQWNYRIMCHPVKRHVPLHAFRLVDDIKTRKMRRETTEKLSMTRKARFHINHILRDRYREEGSKGPTLLDEIMNEIPGKDNYQGYIEDETLDGNSISDIGGGKLNAAFYHRFFKLAQKDAMGTAKQRRGFADDSVFFAKTTQTKIAPMTQTLCNKRGRNCKTDTSRWTYAIPLEMIYLTPLSSWNPYGIKYKGSAKSEEGMNVNAGERYGGYTDATAYNGTNSKLYYMTPKEFFQNANSDKTSADTARGLVGVLDGKGVVREVKAAGTRILFPNIPGVGRLRQRYPIMPVHSEGTNTYKDLEALADIVMDIQDNMELLRKPLVNEPFTKHGYQAVTLKLGKSTFVDELFGPHVHTVELTEEDVEEAKKGKKIEKVTTESEGHTHSLKIAFLNGKWLAWRCDDLVTCWDGHRRRLMEIE